MDSKQKLDEGFALGNPKTMSKDLLNRIHEYQRKSVDRKNRTNLIKKRTVFTPKLSCRGSTDYLSERKRLINDPFFSIPLGSAGLSPRKATNSRKNVARPVTCPNIQRANFENSSDLQEGKQLLLDPAFQPGARVPGQNAPRHFNPTFKYNHLSIQQQKEDEIDLWMEDNEVSPIAVLLRVADESPVHSHILNLIAKELSDIDFSESSEENVDDFDRDVKTVIENCNPEIYEQCGNSQDVYSTVREDTIDEMVEYNFKTREIRRENEEIEKEIKKLEAELKEEERKKREAEDENRAYRRLYFQEFKTYDLPINKEERIPTKEEEKEQEEKEKAKNDEEKHLFIALYGEKAHLQSDYRAMSHTISEFRKEQLRITDDNAYREFNASEAPKKK